jgi:hypothetical protein
MLALLSAIFPTHTPPRDREGLPVRRESATEGGNHVRKLITVLAGLAILMALATPASAFTRADRWKCRSDGAAVERGWTRDEGDSPNDSGRAAFRVVLNEGEYLYCYSPTGPYSPLQDDNIDIEDVINLSYEIKAPVTGAGQTYIAAIFTNGTTAFLDPFYCQGTTSDPNWIRSDFTGATGEGACTLYYDNVAYTSTATDSAWDVLAAAHPELVLDYVFIGFWTFPGSGDKTYVVDRIALGDRLYFGGGYRQIRDCSYGEIYC